jgi:hypothetical protein
MAGKADGRSRGGQSARRSLGRSWQFRRRAAFDWCIAEVGHNPLNYNFPAGETARPASIALAAPPQAAIDTQSGPQHLPRPWADPARRRAPLILRKHARPPSASSPTFARAAIRAVTRAPDRRKKSPQRARSLKIPRDAARRTVKNHRRLVRLITQSSQP